MKNKSGILPVYFYLIVTILLFGTVLFGSQMVTTVAENSPIPIKPKVIIDAGHGGIDGGATSCTGVLESKINLEIAQRLNDLFHLLGVQTVMIRTDDYSVYTEGQTIAAKKISDLKERVRIATEAKDAVVLSIHQNYFSASKYSGAQVFYNGHPEAKQLAYALQNEFVKTLNPGSNRHIKKADGIYFMEKITCPGILIECGFLSNPAEEAQLRSHDYQKSICCVIASVTTQYLQQDIPLA